MIVHTTPRAKGAKPPAPAAKLTVARSRRRLSPHHDHFERHAEDAADLIARGEVSVARILSRRSAASYALPHSAGEPLPFALRDRFEEAFGTDLSVVRVHHDAAAATAAKRERALAFTAGRDIYFGAGEYRPDSPDGRRLIAHELAHVLQQTAQPGANGALRATAATGSGPIQRVEQQDPFADSTVTYTLQQILDLHKAAATDQVAKDEIAMLSGAALTASDPRQFFQTREQFVHTGDTDPLWKKTTADLHPATVSCLYDGLKWAQRWGGAATLLIARSDELTTLFLSSNAYAVYLSKVTYNGAIDELHTIWNRDSFFAGARPRDVIDRMTIYLLGPTRAPSRLALAQDRDFITAATEEMKKAEKPERPIQNELYFATVGMVMEFERLRFSIVADEEQKIKDDVRLAQRKLQLAHRFSARAEKEHADAIKKRGQTRAERGYSQETLHVWVNDFLPALSVIADAARSFWTGVAGLEDPHHLVPDLGATPAELIRTMSEDAFFDAFRPGIDTVADTMLFRHPDGALPTPEEYNSRKESAEKSLRRLSYESFERLLANLLKQPAPKDGGPERMLFPASAIEAVEKKRWLRLAWVFKSITDLLGVLDKYKFRDELAFIARVAAIDPNYPATDHRDAHRIRMARGLGWIAQVAAWTDLRERTDRVRTATETQGTWTQVGPVVALIGDWREDPRKGIEYLLHETPGRSVIRGWEPFTVEEVVYFFVAKGYRDFAGNISALLSAEKGQYDPKAKPLLDRAYQQSRVLQPVRYIIPAGEWVVSEPAFINATDPSLPAPNTVQRLVRDHPSTAALRDSHEQKFGYKDSVGIVPQLQHPDAVVWIMPKPIELIKKLQISDAVNTALENLLRLSPTIEIDLDGNQEVTFLSPMTVAELKALPWEQWWHIFSHLITGDAARTLLDQIKLVELLKTEGESGLTALKDAQREAFNHERRRLVEHQFKPLLKAYRRTAAAYELIKVEKKDVAVRSLPMEMMRFINRFVSQVQERDDVKTPQQPEDTTPERNAHLAMAFIELSELLEEKLGEPSGLGTDIKGDIVFEFVPVLYIVLDRIDKGGLEPFLVQEERGQSAIITTGKQRLERVLSYMEDLATRRITDYGLVGTAGDGTIEDSGSLQPVDWDGKLDRDTPFTIDGRTWHIIEVRKSFTYHPGAWRRRDKSVRSSKTGSLLKVEGEKSYRDKFNRRRDVLMVLSQEEGGSPIEITEGGEADPASEDLLNQLTWDAVMHARYEHMRELAEAIETIAKYGLDVAELFPGVGPAVAATRLVTGVTAFIASDGPAMVEGLVKDPQKLLADIKTRMSAALDPARILEFLLFDFNGFDMTLKKPNRDVGKKVPASSSGLLKKVLRRVRSIGLGLLNALGRLGLSVRGKRETAQMFVIQRPLLVRMLSGLADWYYVFRQIASDAPELLAELGEFKKHAAELVANLQATIDGMGDIELPEALITVDDLVSVALDVIGHRLGGKYKLGIRVLFKILDVIGAKDRIVKEISTFIRDAAGIKDGDIFPPWNDTFLPWIKTQFKTAQTWLHDTVSPRLEMFDVKLPAPTTTPRISGNEFAEEVPEAMPYGDVYPDALDEAPDLSRGRPLPPRLRAEAESRFGHDFGHVRLHTGAAAERVNTPIGARALTTGSHILLSGEEPQSLDHSHVLRHELAHVVQQTGPRPLGERADQRPRAGTPGVGVRVDRSAESAANRAAGQTARAGIATAPLDAGRGRGGGFQPALVDEIGLRFLKYLVNYDKIEEDVEAIDKRAKRRGLIGRDVREQIAELPAKLVAAFGSLHVHPSFQGTFGGKKTEISKHLKNQGAPIRLAVRALAIDSSDPIRAPKQGTGAKPKMQLNVRKLEAKLSRYIFGKTGILLEIDLKQRATSKIPGKKAGPHDKLVVGDPVDKLTVRFVHLPPIDSNAALWKQALQTRPITPSHPTSTITEDERKELRPRVRLVLQSMGPASNVWNRSAYELDAAVFRRVEELRTLEAQLGTRGFLPAHLLPIATDYVKDTGTPDPTAGQIGLRLGTYADSKNKGSQWGKDRESHHITQYILGAFFRGAKGAASETDPDRRAFKLKFGKNPSIYTSSLNVSGEKVNKFAGTPGTVEIAATEHQRGAIMPAILLARPVHRLGDLHITPKADDFGDPEQTTQAGALNVEFQKKLPPDYKAAEAQSLQDEKAQPHYPAFLAYRQHVGDAKVAQVIYDAIQGTYHELRRYMQPRLKTALITRERQYFNDIAKEAPKTPARGEVTSRQMEVVYTAAVNRNDKVLAEKGWTAE